MSKTNPGYFSILPASVRYADISDKAKLLYAEITCLCNKEGYCWATNSYFSKLYNVDNRTITRCINELHEHKFIKCKYDYKEKKSKRSIYIVDIKKINFSICSSDKNVNTDKNVTGSGDKNVTGSGDKNVAHNNTSINNTSNESSIIHKGTKKEARKRCYKALEKYVPNASFEWIDFIDKYLEKLNADLIINALKETVTGKIRSPKYFRGICENYIIKNYQTLEDVENGKKEFENHKKMSNELKDKARIAFIESVELKKKSVNPSKRANDRPSGYYASLANDNIVLSEDKKT